MVSLIKHNCLQKCFLWVLTTGAHRALVHRAHSGLVAGLGSIVSIVPDPMIGRSSSLLHGFRDRQCSAGLEPMKGHMDLKTKSQLYQ